MHGLWNDVRYAWRTLKKSPGFVFTAVVSLALGIGINTALFSVIHTAMERPVSGRAPWELADLSLRTPTGHLAISYPEFLEIQRRARAFSDVVAVSQGPWRLGGQGRPEVVEALLASRNFFPGFGQPLAFGRGFSTDGAGTGEAVLSHGFWKRRWGADPKVLGQPLVLYAGEIRLTYAIVGVAPPDFRYACMWTPVVIVPLPEDAALRGGKTRPLRLMARVKPGVAMEQARADAELLAGELGPLFPESFGKARLILSPKVRRDFTTRSVAAITQCVVGLVLLIACTNVMNLLLARHEKRRAEMATRLALGASRGRLIRQLLLETLALAAPSALAGFGVALATIHVVEQIPIPGLNGIRMFFYLDGTVLAFAICAGLVGSLAAGLWPARAASRPDLAPALKGAGAPAGRKFGLRGALVTAQLALSMLGISAAAMLVKGVWDLRPFDPGVDPYKVLAATTWPMLSGYTPARTTEFRRQLETRLAGEPGIEALAFAASAPGSGTGRPQRVLSRDSALRPRQETVVVQSNAVGPGYFQTLGIAILRGRELREADVDGRPLCVVNETMARRFWPDREPLGQTVRLDAVTGAGFEVVGVARDTAYEKNGNDYSPTLYLPLSRGDYLTLLVRTRERAGSYAETVRRAIAVADPEMPVVALDRLADRITGGLGATELRLRAGVIGTLGGVALVLSALGLYGVVAYLVARRTREIGIRLALGARRADILRAVYGEGARLVGTGIVAGIALSLVVCPLLTRHLYGVQPNHPGVLVAAASLLAAVAAAAMLAPARRAGRVEALVALRHE